MRQEKLFRQIDVLRNDPFSSLVEKAQAGDNQAIEELIVKIEPIISACIGDFIKTKELQKMNGIGPEDIKQEVLLRVVKNLKTFYGGAQFTSWIYRIVHNYITDLRRAGGRNKEYVPDEEHKDIIEHTVVVEASPLDSLVVKEKHQQLVRAIDSLPPAQREVMRLYTLDELSMSEIAVKIGRSQGTVKAHLHRGRIGVEKFFQAHDWVSSR